ncbi:F0F1 ATP synthase subunit delta [Candidatus Daviesbacteria bacterium]|nr:F0F1 ATP synthase subunit delta [Candidatus Daviesbacteria bacterium]
MIRNRRLNNLIGKMVKNSLDKNGQVDEKKALKFVKVLKSFKSGLALASLIEFKKRLKKELEKHILYIESVTEFPKELTKEAVKLVFKNYAVTSVENKINPSLLGGIRLKIADTVLDDSLLKKLEQLEKKLYE